MDRFNYYFHSIGDYYSQIHQEDGQYTSQPETGQTYGGVVASELSWNHPAPGQPQPYQGLNFPERIPPLLGPDLHQEDGQYTSQPETGQTYGGVVASGLSWSHPAPGQPQPYQGLNFPARIPPLLGSDLRTSQPAPLANITQNDAPPQSPNPQPAVNKRQRRSSAEIKKHFLAGFEKYARGKPLADCSADIKFGTYVTSNGRLREMGQIQYDALEQRDKYRVDKALKDRQEVLAGRLASNFKAVKGFLGGLEAYASGAQLKDCSAIIRFSTYVTAKGFLREQGRTLRESLSPRDKDRVDQALAARKRIQAELIATNDTAMDGFLGGLETYASGAQLQDCSATIKFSNYVTTDGHLLKEGKRQYKKLVGGDGEALVNEALAARRRIAAQRISGDIPHFLAALVPYGMGLDLLTCGEVSGLGEKAERYLTPEGGLTSKGELLIENLPPDQQIYVWFMIGKRQQFFNPSVQVPESPWRLPEMPLSMPEMGGMSQAAMTGPMQTEAMWATAWQLTGQAVPRTRGIPSESAEPTMPYYDREAVGADFWHQYGPTG